MLTVSESKVVGVHHVNVFCGIGGATCSIFPWSALKTKKQQIDTIVVRSRNLKIYIITWPCSNASGPGVSLWYNALIQKFDGSFTSSLMTSEYKCQLKANKIRNFMMKQTKNLNKNVLMEVANTMRAVNF